MEIEHEGRGRCSAALVRQALNTELRIPFDHRGVRKVGFPCADACLVVELDGAQHLADAEAYRRDRRKDAVLQQHGCLALRFLAVDVGEQSDCLLVAQVNRFPKNP